MGYLVASTGRLLLPEPLEPQVLTVLEVELLRHQGWFAEGDVEAVDTLADLARFAGADLARDGDWLVVSTDEEGDPKWSEQATAFYAGLARFVLQGEVRFQGEDGVQWAYRYTPDGMVQDGTNGWDGAAGQGGGEAPPPPAAVEPSREPTSEPTALHRRRRPGSWRPGAGAGLLGRRPRAPTGEPDRRDDRPARRRRHPHHRPRVARRRHGRLTHRPSSRRSCRVEPSPVLGRTVARAGAAQPDRHE